MKHFVLRGPFVWPPISQSLLALFSLWANSTFKARAIIRVWTMHCKAELTQETQFDFQYNNYLSVLSWADGHI